MGEILEAKCYKCGLSQQLLFGAGMLNFDTVSDIPALDENGKLVSVNIRDERYKDYQFYTAPDMYEGDIEGEDELTWSEYTLKSKKNYCPDCKQMTMEFVHIALFD